MKKFNTKICIIGGGPSGAATSIFLAKQGIEHLLVEAARFPRDKICGDGLDLNVIRVLNQIDPQIVEKELVAAESGFTMSGGLRFILHNGKYVDIVESGFQKSGDVTPKRPFFFVSKRADFDNLLFSKIYRRVTTVLEGTRVTGIERGEQGWRIRAVNTGENIEIEAGFLVGADGDHSVVVKHLGERKIDRSHYAAALRQYWTGVKGTHPHNLLEIYFPKALPLSYFWIFPLPEGKCNVGFGMASRHIAKENINIRKEFENLISTDPVLRDRFSGATPDEPIKGWGIPLSGSGRKPNGEGWLLVGDAASLVCPTSGEGVGSGMISGLIAAKFIARAYQKNDYGAHMFRHYYREIHRRLKFEEKLFRFANAIPVWAFTKGINLILSNNYFKNWFAHSEMPKWVHTAFTKEISVDLD